MDDIRYPRGRFEAPSDFSPETRAKDIDVIESTAEKLRNAVSGLNDQQLNTPYRPDGWTPRQIAYHVADSHQLAVASFKWGLTEEQPRIRSYERARWAELPDCEGPVEIAVDLLDALHRRWAILLRSLQADQWVRTIDHASFGTVSLDMLLAIYAWHGPHHIAQTASMRSREGW